MNTIDLLLHGIFSGVIGIIAAHVTWTYKHKRAVTKLLFKRDAWWVNHVRLHYVPNAAVEQWDDMSAVDIPLAPVDDRPTQPDFHDTTMSFVDQQGTPAPMPSSQWGNADRGVYGPEYQGQGAEWPEPLVQALGNVIRHHDELVEAFAGTDHLEQKYKDAINTERDVLLAHTYQGIIKRSVL